MAARACVSYPEHYRIVVDKRQLKQLTHTEHTTHVNGCARRVHQLSEWALLPTKVFIRANYSRSQPLSGKDKEWKLWGRAVQLGSVATMAITFIPAVGGFAVGMPLRIMDQRYRPLFSVLDSSATCREVAPPIALSPEKPFHVRTVNLALVPTSVAISIDLRDPYVRARELGESFVNDPQAPSFVMAQEGWNEDSSQLLCSIMRKKYPYIIHNVAPQILGMNGSVMCFSQHPIEEVVFEKLEHMVWKHSFPPRGILRVRLKTEKGDLLIYGTHTQSCSGKAEATARLKQVEQIHAMVARDQRAEPGVLQIVMGDFNTTEIEEDEKPCLPEERPVLEALQKYFKDPFLIDHDAEGRRKSGKPYFLTVDNSRMSLQFEEPQGSWYFGSHNFTMKPVSPWGTPAWYTTQLVGRARYDRILLPPESPLEGRVESRRIAVAKGSQSPPSDHTPVDGRFWIQPKEESKSQLLSR